MSRIRKNPLRSFGALAYQHESGKPQPTPLPTHVPYQKIKQRPEVFQHRSPAQYVSDAHVRDLIAAASRSDLDPVTVWWDGKHWTLIDGHHRMQAYAGAGRSFELVPVDVFEGTPEQALVRAAGENSKGKLVMTTSEKVNAAWRLVIMAEGLSKAQQAEGGKVSERQVALMRKVKGTLLARGIGRDQLSEMKWHQARAEAQGTSSEWTEEEEVDRVEKMAKALRKALGPTADRQPDLFWRAVEIYSPYLAKALVESYAIPPDEQE